MINENRPILSKRLSAYLIDILFLFIVIGLISEIKFINPYYDKYMESYEKYNEIVEDYANDKITIEEFNESYGETYYLISKYSISYNIVIIVCELLYFGVFQKYNNGQTLGKKLMRIKVVNNDGSEKIGVIKSLIRTLTIFYIYIGSVIPLIINSILVFIFKNNYVDISMIVSYTFLIISIASLILMIIRKDKRGLQDLITDTKVVYVEK